MSEPVTTTDASDDKSTEVGESSVEIPGDEIIVEEITYKACKSMSWASLPLPILPPREEFEKVEKFVYDAISFRTYTLQDRSQMNPAALKTAGLGYKAILDLLRKADDRAMLVKVLLALRSSGGGTTMGKIIRENKKHSTMLHLIFKLEPFPSKIPVPKEGDKSKNHVPLDCSLADAYLNLIVALVSANSVFLTPALNMLWRCIALTDAVTPEDRQLVQFNDENMTQDEIENTIDDQLKRNSRLHGTLSKILHLVPKGSSEIYPVIASAFPFKLLPLNKQASYVKQCFTVLNYVPMIQRNILELCIDKCLEIDVEIRIAQDGNVNIEESKEENHNDIDGAPFTMDEDAGSSSKTQQAIQEQKDRFLAEKTNAEQVDDFAEKLDTLMCLVFQHLLVTIASETKGSGPRDIYKMIIVAFDSVVLTTHRSKFVQFIMLFLCGHDETQSKDELTNQEDEESMSEQLMLSREFAAKLIELVLDPFRPGINRQSAACYLASFVSRSMSVCAGTACEAVSALLRFAEAYMETYHTDALARNAMRGGGDAFGSGSSASKVSVHALFYTVCQAAFYIMCFRGKECIAYYKKAVEYHNNLDDSNDDCEILLYTDPRLIDISSKRWTKIVSHHLHPLKYCLESVRGEFLLLSDRFDLIDEEVLRRLIIEDRKMASGIQKMKAKKPSSIRTAATLEKRRTSGGVGGLGRGSNPLDSFFPFDPYLLRRSYTYIDPHYRHWDSVQDITIEESEDEEIDECIYENNRVQNSDDNDDDDDDDDESESESDHGGEDTLIDASNESCAAMSLTSTTCSVLEGNEDDISDDEITVDDMALPKNEWVSELRRARALSIEDCW